MYKELIEQVIESALDKDYVSFNEGVEEVIKDKMRNTLAENITDIQENLFYEMDESYDTDVLTHPDEDDDDKHEFNRRSQDQPNAGGQPPMKGNKPIKPGKKSASYTDDSEENKPGGLQPVIPISWNHEKIDSDKKALGGKKKKKKISEAMHSNHRDKFEPTHDNDYTGYDSEYDHERDPETDEEKVAFNKAAEKGPEYAGQIATNFGRFESYEEKVAAKLDALKEERDLERRLAADEDLIAEDEETLKENKKRNARKKRLNEMKKKMKDDKEYAEMKDGNGKEAVKDAESKEDDEEEQEAGVEKAEESKKKKKEE